MKICLITSANDLSEQINLRRLEGLPQDDRQLMQFKSILDQLGEDDGTIVLQEHWALYYESIEDFESAAKHKLREIELIRTLLENGGPVGPFDLSYLEHQKRLWAWLVMSAEG